MKSKIMVIFLLVFFFLNAFSYPNFSARREPNENWKIKAAKLEGIKEGYSPQFFSVSALRAAVPLKEVDFTKVNEFDQFKDVQSLFEQSRDAQLFQERIHRDQVSKRRSSWFYPDDGCYIRAEVIRHVAQKQSFKKISKIFVFGNLTLKTYFSKSGEVSWWYHVAPIVRVGQQNYVIDPAVDKLQPLLVSDWLEKINQGKDKALEVSLCKGQTVYPDSPCFLTSPLVNEDERIEDELSESLKEEQYSFLNSEWYRVVNELNLPAERYFGETPPWMQNILEVGPHFIF